MYIKVDKDLSKEAERLSKLISYGGYSDDMNPFYTRNLFIANIKTLGDITKQNLLFTCDAFVKNLPSPYSDFLSGNFLKNTKPSDQSFRIIEPEEGKIQLFNLQV